MARLQQYPLRFEPEERAAWQAAADKVGLPLSEWIRAACNVAANHPRETRQADSAVAEQVKPLGSIPGANCYIGHHVGKKKRLPYGSVCDACGGRWDR